MKISWLPEELVGTSGRLGLTHAPGGEAKHTKVDLDALAAAGVGHVFCLLEADELGWMDPPESLEERRLAVLQRGMAFTHEPIVDFEAPDIDQARRIVSHIKLALEQGDTILHCWAGLGRAGTCAACVLVAGGMSAHDAIVTVRHYRPGAIQSDEQEALIHRFAEDFG